MRFLKNFLLVVLALLVIYLLGPNPSTPVYESKLQQVPGSADSLERFVASGESEHLLKTDNQARIEWFNDSLKTKTEYAIVYLHGFSASQEEGDPVHRNIAQQLGCNLYLSRLSQHGIDTSDALYNITADNLWESAKEAYAIGRQLGRKVILMGTSTGGTLALKLAAEYPDIAALVLYSPNIAINDPNAWLLNNHWGVQIARLVKGSKFNTSQNNSVAYKQYWNHQYRLEAAAELEELLETTMTKNTFNKVKQPVLTLCYYKDESHQDNVVKVSAMKEMMEQLGTPANLRKFVPLPGPANHVLASPILSKDVERVQAETLQFLQSSFNFKQ
jgi:esterase/lipase